jgi:SM-20-related protein
MATGKAISLNYPNVDRKAQQTFQLKEFIRISDVLSSNLAEGALLEATSITEWSVATPAHIQIEEQTGFQRNVTVEALRRVENLWQTPVNKDELSYHYLYRDLSTLDSVSQHASCFPLLLMELNSTAFLEFVRKLTGDISVHRADGHLTLFAPGSFITRHSDVNGAHQRKIAYVLNLTKSWSPDWGGQLLLQNLNGEVTDALVPVFNSLILFKVPKMHSVSYVPPFAPLRRFALTGWFYADGENTRRPD